ncbi:unnamed protein product [Orchesella dallaii]|uniref:Nucleoplasmin core domain-containing protein n=1 Tax=Orchesella dallaii TaxID=48710 RepID=A0ABP1QMT4_9HEXA
MFCLLSENAEIVPCVAAETRRYMFATALSTETQSEYEWDARKTPYINKQPETKKNEAFRQILVIRRVILGPTAKEGEKNTISVVIDDPEEETESFPMIHLSKGKEVQAMIDLTFPDRTNVNVKFVLTEGTGPIHLIGYHLIERLVVDVSYEANEADVTTEDEGLDDKLSEEDAKMVRSLAHKLGNQMKELAEREASSKPKKVKKSQDLNKSVVLEDIESESEPDKSEEEVSFEIKSPSYSPM